MKLKKEEYLHSDLTDKIIKVFYEIYNEMGYGFLESVYEKSFEILLPQYGLTGEFQIPINVYFRGNDVGKFRADFVVNDLVLVELKAVQFILPEHSAQVLNYLRATKYEVGLLLNFGHKAQVKRFIFDNDRKKKYSSHR